MKTKIHVNQHNIKHNAKEQDTDKHRPVLTVKTYKSNIKCNRVKILGESEVVYSPDNPLSCGAKVWIQTDSGVEVESGSM